ncbi:MAG: hypothetical protein ACKOAD_07625 [Gammaproteobacteria bacterium]
MGLTGLLEKIWPKNNPSTLEDLLASLCVLASIVEARDPYTGGHLWRVAQMSRLVSEAMGLEKSAVARISLSGILLT